MLKIVEISFDLFMRMLVQWLDIFSHFYVGRHAGNFRIQSTIDQYARVGLSNDHSERELCKVKKTHLLDFYFAFPSLHNHKHNFPAFYDKSGAIILVKLEMQCIP
jgi:hypothetical protein